ncbi:uncharacterized protein LOC142784514 isoform X4 [Rhipicephalus microplus]|uniref:uncharacterized protein LOC142784514 isoform X4 n=1 Tax=Rhipicephalus microplus TaxID=6941 RepID=UPI003F6C6A6A
MLVSRKAYRAKCATTLEVSEKAALWIELAEQIFLEDLAKKCRKMVIKQGKKGKKTLRRRDVARAYQDVTTPLLRRLTLGRGNS